MMFEPVKQTRAHSVNPPFAQPVMFALYRNGLFYKTAISIVLLTHVVQNNPDFANGETATIVTYNFSSAFDARAVQP